MAAVIQGATRTRARASSRRGSQWLPASDRGRWQSRADSHPSELDDHVIGGSRRVLVRRAAVRTAHRRAAVRRRRAGRAPPPGHHRGGANLRDRAPGIDTALANVVARCLRRDREAQFAEGARRRS